MCSHSTYMTKHRICNKEQINEYKENKVNGCASQVWLATAITPPGCSSEQASLTFTGDSDAHIVKGLIAILFVLYSGKSADEIVTLDVKRFFHEIGLDEHLSPQRSNGLNSMVGRIKLDAQSALVSLN